MSALIMLGLFLHLMDDALLTNQIKSNIIYLDLFNCNEETLAIKSI